MTNNEIEVLMRKVAKEAVEDTLTALGIDADSVHETQADMLYLRQQRKGALAVGRGVRLAIIGAFVSGACYALIWGIRMAIKHIGGG